MGINSNNDKEKRDEASGKNPQTPVEKQVSDTKEKAHNAQQGKK